MKLDMETPIHRGGSIGGGEEDEVMASLSHLDRMANWREMWNPRLSMSLTSTKGLLNAPGDNNCFLNSAVQVLWHLDVFRRSFRLLSGHACMGNSCIFCALKVLFTQFQYSDRSTLPPDALRKALATSFQDQHRFQLGHMDDAAECFENILTRIHYHIANGESEDLCKARHCIPHQKFAMSVVEQIICQCGATSEPLPFTQMVHYVSASALVCQAKLVEAQVGHVAPPTPADLFAQLLRNAASEGDIRNCPSKCGKKVQIRRNLTNCPDVVSIGLIWDSDRPSLEHIKDVVRSIGTAIRLRDLFHSVVEDPWAQSLTLHLVGVVCYYGKHYSTFFFHSKMKKWVYFDDAHVKEMGPDWQNVADKCCRGHYQPLLLLYANSESGPIETRTAPQITTKLPGYQHFSHEGNHGNGSRPSRPRSDQNDPSSPPRGQYMSYETSLRNDVTRMRRAMTPGPEHGSQYSDVQVIPRRAITPGPEWGRYRGEDEVDGQSKAEAVHFRQPSYLMALDVAPGEKVREPRSKTATHGGDPYYSANMAQENFSQHLQSSKPPPMNMVNGMVDRYDNLPHSEHNHMNPSSRHQSMNGMQGPHHGSQGHTVQHHGNNHVQTGQHHGNHAQTGQHHGNHHAQTMQHYGNSQGQYQYCAPQTYPPKAVMNGVEGNAPKQSNQLAKTDYPEWSRSTSEPYRRHNVPKSPTKEDNVAFVYPTSPSKNQTPTALAKVNEIQRIDSFKKGKGRLGAGHYQVSESSKPQPKSGHPYGPLDPEALYPGHESGVMQASSTTNPNHIPCQMPNSQSHPALKSETQTSQSNLKRTRSLENTNQLPPDVPTPSSSNANTVGRTRPQSARPFEYPGSKCGGEQAGSHRNAPSAYITPQQGVAQPDRRHDIVNGKPPKPMPSNGKPGHRNWKDEEDPYGTLQYINRRAVENILNYQQQKPAGSSNRGHPSQNGPGSAGSRSSNSSLDSMAAEQLSRSQVAPPRPALPEALKVDIPGDNLSLGSHQDSGYRSANSDRTSGSSSVESPVNDGTRVVPGREPLKSQSHLSYGSGDTRTHSSSDSLSSGHSYATVKATQLIRVLDKASHVQKSQSFLEQTPRQLDPNQTVGRPPLPPHAKGQRPHAGDGFESTCFQAENLMQESAQKELDGDLHTAMVLCTQALGCLQHAQNIPQLTSETKAYVRMKHNTCLLRIRSLHWRLPKRQDSANGSDLSAEDHTSVSSPSTEADGTSFDSPQHQPKDLVNHQHNKVPGSTFYEQQYSSDSGYSSHSVDLARQSHIPHSHTDPALTDYTQHPAGKGTGQHGLSPYDKWSSGSDNNKSVEIYATLPKKRSAKPKVSAPAQQSEGPQGLEVYQSYLQRQKEAAQSKELDLRVDCNGYQKSLNPEYPCMGKNQDKAGEQFSPPQHYAPQGNHSRQNSNSKLNKEQIKQILIHDFMARKEGKGKEDHVNLGEKTDSKQHHIHGQLHGALDQQMRCVSINNSKRAQSELNLHQGMEYNNCNTPDYPQYQDGVAMGYMAHPDSRQSQYGQNLGVQHSRESSCSSTNTVTAHSRENSLSGLSGEQYSNSRQYHQNNSSGPPQGPETSSYGYVQVAPMPAHQGFHPNYSDVPVNQPALVPPRSPCIGKRPKENGGTGMDRDVHPPKPSMIGKLDKMHHRQPSPSPYAQVQNQQIWQSQHTDASWSAHNLPPAPAMRKSTSHSQLPAFDNGQVHWTATSDGDVPAEGDKCHLRDNSPTNIPGVTDDGTHLDSTRGPSGGTSTLMPVVRSGTPPSKPPVQTADSSASTNGNRSSPASSDSSDEVRLPGNSDPDSVSSPASAAGGDQQRVDSTNANNRTVSAMVASFEANTVPIQKKVNTIKMKPQHTKCTFSTFFAPPSEGGDRSSLSSLESSGSGNFRTLKSDTSCDSTDCSSKYSTMSDSQDNGKSLASQTALKRQPRRPKSALKKKSGRRRKKSVTFSDNIALVVDPDEVAGQEIDYLQYVSKVLEMSKKRNQGLEQEATKECVGPRIGGDLPDVKPNGYDSDFDEDTGSSVSSSETNPDLSRCSLCQKKVVEIDELYCPDCRHYMSRFQPTAS